MKNKSLFALQVVTEEKIIVGSLKLEDCYKLFTFNMQVAIIIIKSRLELGYRTCKQPKNK